MVGFIHINTKLFEAAELFKALIRGERVFIVWLIKTVQICVFFIHAS